MPDKMPPAYRPRTDFLSLGHPSAGGFGGAPFYDLVEAARFPQSVLRFRNNAAAETVGLDALTDTDWIRHFGAFEPLPGSFPRPAAIRYHGHQFRTYNPDIGDGRGFLFGQLEDARGRLLDLGTKGSGRTPYSRTADGRLTLKGAVREILATEMLEALGVNTSKTLSVIETGEALERHDEPSPTRSAVLVRLGHSHVRFGAFQRLAFENDAGAIARLVDYCVGAFDPDLAMLEDGERAARFFERVIARTAAMTAQWMAAGFVHGVLNTDNMNVTGESFDYGPWRFLPTVDFTFTAAYFDHTGLYAYGQQPDAAAWNLSRLGGALSIVADAKRLNEALQTFSPAFEAGLADAFARRLGVVRLGSSDREGFEIAVGLLTAMQEAGAPFQQTFHDWFGGEASAARRSRSQYADLYASPPFAAVGERISLATPLRPERLDGDYFHRSEPEDMLIDEVEAIWARIAAADDWSALNDKISRLRAMGDSLGLRR